MLFKNMTATCGSNFSPNRGAEPIQSAFFLQKSSVNHLGVTSHCTAVTLPWKQTSKHASIWLYVSKNSEYFWAILKPSQETCLPQLYLGHAWASHPKLHLTCPQVLLGTVHPGFSWQKVSTSIYLLTQASTLLTQCFVSLLMCCPTRELDSKSQELQSPYNILIPSERSLNLKQSWKIGSPQLILGHPQTMLGIQIFSTLLGYLNHLGSSCPQFGPLKYFWH